MLCEMVCDMGKLVGKTDEPKAFVVCNVCTDGNVGVTECKAEDMALENITGTL